MAMVNTYYDFDDYNEPVKTYFDDQFYYDFVADFEKQIEIYVRQNSVEQKDNIYRYTSNGDESDFISMSFQFIFSWTLLTNDFKLNFLYNFFL